MSDEYHIPQEFKSKVEAAGFSFKGTCRVCGGNAWRWEKVKDNALYVVTLKKQQVIDRKPDIKFVLKVKDHTTLGPLNTVDQVLQANGF